MIETSPEHEEEKGKEERINSDPDSNPSPGAGIDTVEFHESCRHYGDDYEEAAPEGAEITPGEEYCSGCWSQIVDTGYPHSTTHNARRFKYGIRI